MASQNQHPQQTVQIIQSSGGGQVTTTSGVTVLSNAQATQLLQKLRSANAGQGNHGPQSIKIQAVQTNPPTGARQIVAIPIQSTQLAGSGGIQSVQAGTNPGGSKVNVSPMKVIRLPGGMTQGNVIGHDGIPHGIKVVKLPASSIAAGGGGGQISGVSTGGQVVTNARINTLNIKPATTHAVSQVSITAILIFHGT